MTRRQFLALPVRKWDKPSIYDSLYIVPSYERHIDSGYRIMAIVGSMQKQGPVEIAALCDVIDWDRAPGLERCAVMNEMDPSTNILHVWSHTCRFRVGPGLYTSPITIIERASN